MLSLSIPKRYELVLMIAFGAMIAYAMRVNMSVASLAMMENLNWTTSQQGLALSGFYWGYAAGQLLAAPLVQRIGAKVSFAGAILLSSITTLFIPIAFQHSFGLGLFIRVLTGLFESFVFPAIYHFIPAWIPLEEKTLLVPVIYAGSYVGNIITFSVSGSVIDKSLLINGKQYGEWLWIFYIFAIIGLGFVPYWMIMAYETPDQHPSISAEELAFIHSGKHYLPTVAVVEKVEENSVKDGLVSVNDAPLKSENPVIVATGDNKLEKVTGGEEEAEDQSLVEYSYPIGVVHLAHNIMAVASSARIGRLHGDPLNNGEGVSQLSSLSSSIASGRPRKVSIVSIEHHMHDEMAAHTPWMAFLTHPVSLTMLFNSWVSGWVTFTLMSEMPHYLNSIGFNVSSSGMLCVYPYIALFISSLAFGAILEYLHIHFHFSTNTIRRLAETVAFLGAGVGLIICGFMTDKNTSYAFLIVTQSMYGAVQSGIQCAYSDVAPNYSSAMNTLGNFLSAAAGIAGPLVIADLLTSLGETWGWRVAFILTLAQCVLALILWYIYQTAEIIPELNNPTSESHQRKVSLLIPGSELHARDKDNRV
jgi:MFS family permease